MDTTTDIIIPYWTKGYKPVVSLPLACFWKGRDNDHKQEHQRSLRDLAAAYAHRPLLRHGQSRWTTSTGGSSGLLQRGDRDHVSGGLRYQRQRRSGLSLAA